MPEMSGVQREWRVLDGVRTAWFETSSLTESAAVAGHVAETTPEALIDLRVTGVRVRVESDEQADAVSAAADELGLMANPAGLQQVDVVVESERPADVGEYWRRVLGYAAGDDGLADPLRRDPSLRLVPSSGLGRLRHRIHLDVVRPAAEVAAADLGEPFGPYGVCHADAEGNEVDVVPGDPLGEAEATADWQAVFAAMACYRTTPAQQRELAIAAAAIADEVGFPLLIDLRPGLVLLDSGKDRWDADAHGLDLDFADLAVRIQQAARDLGATADASLPRFVQIFLDAADVEAVRAFWMAALGYVPDRRAHLTDIADPLGLNPVLLFQELDASDTERRRQRNRMYVELTVPSDAAEHRFTTALSAGGRVVDTADGRWRVADPEGNELLIVAGG